MVIVYDIKLLKKHLQNKFGDYRKRDKKLGLDFKLSVHECIQLIKETDSKCPECNCEMLFEEYKPWCLYQFSLDKIDNEKGHAIENLRIICYYCNAKGGWKLTKYDKDKENDRRESCSQKCHIVTTNDQPDEYHFQH